MTKKLELIFEKDIAYADSRVIAEYFNREGWQIEDVENFVKTYRKEIGLPIGDISKISKEECELIQNGCWFWDDWNELCAYDLTSDVLYYKKKLQNALDNVLSKKELTNQKTAGYVYIFYDKKYKLVKIGKSKNVMSRFRSLQTGNPNLILYAYVKCEDYNKTENYLHKLFNDKKVKGEWFSVAPLNCLQEIKKIKLNPVCVNASKAINNAVEERKQKLLA